MVRLRHYLLMFAVVFGAIGVVAELRAQGTDPLAVGAEAPDFSLPGATAEGMLPEPVTMAGLAGKTVVLAFFYKARTKG